MMVQRTVRRNCRSPGRTTADSQPFSRTVWRQSVQQCLPFSVFLFFSISSLGLPLHCGKDVLLLLLVSYTLIARKPKMNMDNALQSP